MESVEYLYSTNSFLTSSPNVMQYLPLFMLPQRINAIRMLTFHWTSLPNNIVNMVLDGLSPRVSQGLREQHICWKELRAAATYPHAWNQIWHNIAAMAGLKTLIVKLEIDFPTPTSNWGNLNQETSDILLAPILGVIRPTTFILSLPFPAMDSEVARAERLAKLNWYQLPTAVGASWEGVDPWDALPHCTIRRVRADG